MKDVNKNTNLFSSFTMTKEESDFIESILNIDSLPHNTTVMQKKLSISVLYLAKKIEKSGEQSGRQALAMNILTVVIIITYVIQIWIALTK